MANLNNTGFVNETDVRNPLNSSAKDMGRCILFNFGTIIYRLMVSSMHKNSSKYLQNITIILMMVLLCLPCTVKRAVKQSAGIPVSAQQAAKSHHVVSCQFAGVNAPSIAVSKQKDTYSKKGFSAALPVVAIKQEGKSTRLLGLSSRSDAIPIYILHEQYLI
jgi:hypothetical protein